MIAADSSQAICSRTTMRNKTLRYTTTNNPRGNGIVETTHRTINEIMRIFHRNTTVKQLESLIDNRLNLLPHLATKIAPFTLQYSRIYGTEKQIENLQCLIDQANHANK